jgi:hypothetical protein
VKSADGSGVSAKMLQLPENVENIDKVSTTFSKLPENVINPDESGAAAPINWQLTTVTIVLPDRLAKRGPRLFLNSESENLIGPPSVQKKPTFTE